MLVSLPVVGEFVVPEPAKSQCLTNVINLCKASGKCKQSVGSLESVWSSPIWTGHPSNEGGGAGTMSGTCAKFTGGDRKHNARGRWSVGKKVRLIEASMAPGQSVSLVARTYGVASNLLYR